jgi:hypothetical protein
MSCHSKLNFLFSGPGLVRCVYTCKPMRICVHARMCMCECSCMYVCVCAYGPFMFFPDLLSDEHLTTQLQLQLSRMF